MGGASPEELFLILRVNREFERVFGYSQVEMREVFKSEGSKVLYQLLAPQSLPLLTQWLTEAMLGGRTEYRQLVTVVNKYKGTVRVRPPLQVDVRQERHLQADDARLHTHARQTQVTPHNATQGHTMTAGLGVYGVRRWSDGVSEAVEEGVVAAGAERWGS